MAENGENRADNLRMKWRSQFSRTIALTDIGKLTIVSELKRATDTPPMQNEKRRIEFLEFDGGLCFALRFLYRCRCPMRFYL